MLCPYCEKDLLNKENYEGHINAKHEKKFCYKCPSCSYVSLWRKGFREHLCNAHKIEERNNEEIDNKYKRYDHQLIDKVRHKRTSEELSSKHSKSSKKEKIENHTDSANHVPSNSQTNSNDKTSTSNTKMQKISNSLDWGKCKKDFSDESIWAHHMQQTHETSQILLLCPECDYRSQHQTTFLSHRVQIHESRISDVNDLDIYRVTMKEGVPLIKSANNSEKTHHRKYMNVNGEYYCPRCDYTYETINLLEAHCKEGHGPQTWYLCPCCPYENRFLNGVRNHLFTKHKESAACWGRNLEGRKVDKSRFQFYGQLSPPIRSVNAQANKDVECVTIDDD